MKKTTQTFDIEIENDDIIERAIEILQTDKEKDLWDFFENFDEAICKYAKAKLDLIDLEDAKEYCPREHKDD